MIVLAVDVGFANNLKVPEVAVTDPPRKVNAANIQLSIDDNVLLIDTISDAGVVELRPFVFPKEDTPVYVDAATSQLEVPVTFNITVMAVAGLVAMVDQIMVLVELVPP